jgi:[protein-PII] uridylyltransferase
VIAEIAKGRLAENHPLSVSIFPLIEDVEALFLAMLLHDTGKGGVGGQELAGARAARAACERLGLERDRVDLVAWLVEHLLMMSDYAQKRDVTDPGTVAAFARIVENPERLRLLLVLTVADIRAVGPDVWNGWKGQLLRELYGATEAIFRGGRGADPAASFARHLEGAAGAARSTLVAADPAAADWASAMENAYFTGFSAAEHLNHAALARKATAQGGVAAEAWVAPDRHAAEVILTAPDRQGLFADLSLAIAGFGANVVGARAFTSKTGQALDVFYVQDASGAPYGLENPRALERLASALECAARGAPVAPESRRAPDMSRMAAFAIAPTVSVDNDASQEASVVEVSGRDRPGLLGAIAQVLAEAGLSIQSAHIDSYGERAVDAFYVCDSAGGKLTDARKTTALKQVLTEVLDEDGDAPPRRLQRARASIAR